MSKLRLSAKATDNVLKGMLAKEQAPAEAHRQGGPHQVHAIKRAKYFSVDCLSNYPQLSGRGRPNSKKQSEVAPYPEAMEGVLDVAVAQVNFKAVQYSPPLLAVPLKIVRHFDLNPRQGFTTGEGDVGWSTKTTVHPAGIHDHPHFLLPSLLNKEETELLTSGALAPWHHDTEANEMPHETQVRGTMTSKSLIPVCTNFFTLF